MDNNWAIKNPGAVEPRLKKLEQLSRRAMRSPVFSSPDGNGDSPAGGGVVPTPDPTEISVVVSADYSKDGKYRPLVTVSFDPDWERFVRTQSGFEGYTVRITSPLGEVIEVNGSVSPDAGGYPSPDALTIRSLQDPASGSGGTEAWSLIAKVRNSYGDGAWSSPVSFTLAFDASVPTTPATPTLSSKAGIIAVTFTPSTDPNYSHTEIWKGIGSGFTTSTGVKITDNRIGVEEISWDNALDVALGYNFIKVRHVNKVGTPSALSAGVSISSGILLGTLETSANIAPGNVLPSHTNFNLPILYNGNLEIPNSTNTNPDDWTFSGTTLWEKLYSYTGLHCIKMGGVAGTHTAISPAFRWPLFTRTGLSNSPVFLLFAYNYLTGMSPTVTVQVLYFDVTGSVAATETMVSVISGVAPPWSSSPNHATWVAQVVSAPGAYVSTAVSAAIKITAVTTGTDEFNFDALMLANPSDNLLANSISFYDSNGISLQAAIGATSGGDIDISPNARIEGYEDLLLISAPTAPPTGYTRLYTKSGNGLFTKSPAGVEAAIMTQAVLSGTSFPSSPVGGQLFFRTDLGVLCWYDATNTRWLGPEVQIGLTTYQGIPDFSANTEAYVVAADQAHSLLVTRFDAAGFVFTTNSVLNYWNYILRKLNSGVSVVNLATIDTHLWSHDTWTVAPQVTSFTNNPVATGDYWLQIFVQTTGSPGPTRPAFKVMGRYIYT